MTKSDPRSPRRIRAEPQTRKNKLNSFLNLKSRKKWCDDVAILHSFASYNRNDFIQKARA